MTDVDRLRGYERGAVDYISVPVIAEVLRAKVHIFAELHRKTRQLELLNHELHRLSRTLIATQDEERRRIARELHDGLGQELVAAKMILGTLKYSSMSVDQATSELTLVIDRLIQQVRSMSHLLHPPLLDEVGLRSALEWYVEGLAKRSGIDTSLEIQPRNFPRLAPELETAVFRIVQEALTNMFRHSGAQKGSVTLVQENGRIVVTVLDDGKGIESGIAQLRPGSIGIGLGGMIQRARQFGGELHLSNTNPGTLVEVVLPCTPQETAASLSRSSLLV
jgi:signal transduction histidine kinase